MKITIPMNKQLALLGMAKLVFIGLVKFSKNDCLKSVGHVTKDVIRKALILVQNTHQQLTFTTSLVFFINSTIHHIEPTT